MGKEIIKIGVFYDGNFFLHVSNYYSHCHPVHRRIQLPGFHQFLRREVALTEGLDMSQCQIITAHFFRGRFSAVEAQDRPNQLYNDRVFDDILMSMGVEAHYLPLRSRGTRKKEKGIDVWFALEAYEQAITRHLDVVFLITSDNEHLPLLRKLKALGVTVYVLDWNFTFEDSHGNRITTLTSQELLNEACETRDMACLVKEGLESEDVIITGMFSPALSTGSTTYIESELTTDSGCSKMDEDEDYEYTAPSYSEDSEVTSDAISDRDEINYSAEANSEKVYTGRIVNIIYQKGFGFISTTNENIFFFYKSVVGINFQDLNIGDPVSYTIGYNRDGREVAENVQLVKTSEGKEDLPFNELDHLY